MSSERRIFGSRSVGKALQAEALPPPAPADAFWGDFKARARLHPQHQPAVASPRYALRWAVAAACTLLLMTGAGIWRIYLPQPLSSIDRVDVRVRHEAVFVMDDAATQSTLLWVVGMDETPNGGEG